MKFNDFGRCLTCCHNPCDCEKNSMKILYFDCETTGTNHLLNEIVQFAAIVEIDSIVKEQVNFKCQPTNWEAIDAKALEVTGLTIEKLKTFEKPEIVAKNIQNLFNKYIDKYDKTDKFFPAGHNVLFDINFLQSFWIKHLDKYGTGSYQNWQSLDSRVFANFLNVAGKLKVENIKLETLCKYYGIEINAHDALSDINATRLLIKKMISFL